MKPRIYLFLLFIFTPHIITAQVPDTLKYTLIGPEDFLRDYKFSKNAVIIDVRKYKDYRKSRIEGAINIEYTELEEYFTTPGIIDNRKSIFIYCYVGYHSKRAAVIFYDHGYRNISSLEGGFMKWKSKKMPVEGKRAESSGQGAQGKKE
jgi:rhodanese-related sulfurtransferase